MKEHKLHFKGVTMPPTDQAARSLLDQAKGQGWVMPKGLDEQRIINLLHGKAKWPRSERLGESLQGLANIGRRLQTFRKRIADKIESTIAEPESFGIEDYAWRECQQKTLADLATVFRNGYSRIDFELPTGGGKSHVLGAFTRSFLEAVKMQKLNIKRRVKIVALTSRTNLVEQLAGYEESDKEAESAEDEGSALQIGDLRQWVAPILDEEFVQVLTGESSNAEIAKEAVLTVQTYQGLTQKRLNLLLAGDKLRLFILDESHNATERVRQLLLQHAPDAFILGGSATPFGPERNPFTLFEEVVDGPAKHRRHPWEKKLASHQSLVELIGRKELKQPRLIRADTEISLADVRSREGVLNEQDVGKVLSHNLPLLKKLLRRLYTKDHPVLAATRRPQLRERVTIAFVNSVHIAEELAKYVNQTLKIPATVLSGQDSLASFNNKQEAMQTGEIRFAATVRKGTEGLDVQAANAVILLQPHGPKSEWLRRQELGRVLRVNVKDPNDDALIIDAVYKDQPGSVSTLSLFGEHQYIDGALIAASPLRDVERLVINLLQEGKTLQEVIDSLDEPHHSLAIQLFIRKASKGRGGPRLPSPPDQYNLKKVHLVEDPDAIKILMLHDRELLLQKAREALAAHGVTSRNTLMQMGSKFKKTLFAEFGKGRAFFGAIVRMLPNDDDLDLTHLAELANKLGWAEENRVELLNRARVALAKHGITSRDTLFQVVSKFRGLFFPGFGKGKAFLRKILYVVGGAILLSHLKELADELGWLNERETELHTRARKALSEHGVNSQQELIDNMGSEKFIETYFTGFGKGIAFFSSIVRKLGKKESITLKHLEEFAHKLGWPAESRDELLNRARISLKANGITSRETLMKLNRKDFQNMYFGGFGKIYALYQKIIRPLNGKAVNSSHLANLADLLGWPAESQESSLERARTALKENGITSREALINIGRLAFIQMSFTGFGKGQAMFTEAVRKLDYKEPLRMHHIVELADALGW